MIKLQKKRLTTRVTEPKEQTKLLWPKARYEDFIPSQESQTGNRMSEREEQREGVWLYGCVCVCVRLSVFEVELEHDIHVSASARGRASE